MAAITAELRTVGKNLMVETGKGKGYRAVSERDIIDAVKPLEEKHGVYSYPCARDVLESQTLESESTYNGNTTKKTTFFTRIRTVYRFVNIDDPTEYIETVTFAEGIDAQDKGSGKAMTYGDKYALMKAYKISTGDDPDQEASTETQYTAKKGIISCTGCGSVIADTVNRQGEPWTAEAIASYSNRRFGRVLCPDCQRKAMKSEG
jgi:ribosomal protein S27E